VKLQGDQNQCRGCSLYFNSSAAFDKHRVGTFGVDRRCLTVPEMEARGMATNKDGFWVARLQGEAWYEKGHFQPDVSPKQPLPSTGVGNPTCLETSGSLSGMSGATHG